MNSHLKTKNSPNSTKEEPSQHQTQSRHEKQKHKCPSCQEHSHLMCYACCFEFACENCYTSEHYAQCNKKFNHYPINILDLALEESTKTKRNNKKSKLQEKCQRCFDHTDMHQYCMRCKVVLCAKCLSQTHSMGKFSHHIRIKNSNSPSKLKKMETFMTETDEVEENVMKKSTKQNIQHTEQGGKIKDRSNKLYSTPSQKKGKSITKISNQNQQNLVMTASKRQNPQTNNESSSHPPRQIPQNPWQTCAKHQKARTILTQNFDIICQECYEHVKTTLPKLKNVDLPNWISNNNKQTIKLNLETSLNQFTLKMKQLESEFSKYRQNLLQEFTKKEQILAQRYRNNLLNLQKWENIYKANMSNIITICENSLKLANNASIPDKIQSKDKFTKSIQDIFYFKSLLALEEISQCKKEYYSQEEQYQFKINQINTQCFEDLVKSFHFIRKKIDNQNQMSSSNQQKSLSKINQSNQLRQSRFSNSSLKTDRKTIVRDDSFQKSNYYQLSNSNNLLKRSMSKEIKDDITKDISQKILFQNSSALKSEKKSICSNGIKKIQPKQIKNSQYFFESVQDAGEKLKAKPRKQPIQLSSYCFKEVKYVDLQNFLTQKLDKLYDQKKETRQSVNVEEHKSNLFKNDMEISTQLIDLRQQEAKSNPITDSRMTYSVNIGAASSNMSRAIAESAATSTNNSIHNNNKNKRKSDYMEMRDRLRKPNVMHKIGK